MVCIVFWIYLFIVHSYFYLCGDYNLIGLYACVLLVMPIGSTDGTGYRYPLNYGTVYGEKDQTAYIMGIHHPVRNFDGRVIAVLRNKKEKK